MDQSENQSVEQTTASEEGPVSQQFIMMEHPDTLTVTQEDIGKGNQDELETFTIQFSLPDHGNVNVNSGDEPSETQQLQEENLNNDNEFNGIHSQDQITDDGGGTGNSEGQVEILITHPHPSVVTGLGDITLRLCDDTHCECGGSGTSVHCPMCPGSETLGDLSSAESHILETHWLRRTEVCKDICLLTCLCVDVKSPHIHCPLCGDMLNRDVDESHHLILCINKQKDALYSNTATPLHTDQHSSTQTAPTNSLISNDTNKAVSLEESPKAIHHPTMVASLEDIELKPCTSCCGGKKCHCPICPVSLYRPNKELAVRNHLEVHHWKHSLKFKDFFIMRCTAPCKGKVNGVPLAYHWHCPLCPIKVSSKQALASHLQAHKRGTQLRHRTNAEWADMLGPEAASVIFKSKSLQKTLEEGTDYGGMEMDNENDQTFSEMDVASTDARYNGGRAKKKEVFQTVVGLLTKDMMQAIPGSVSVYFNKVQEEENIQFTATDDWCLLQAEWKSMAKVQKRLKGLLREEKQAEEDDLYEPPVNMGDIPGPGGDRKSRKSQHSIKESVIMKENSPEASAESPIVAESTVVDDVLAEEPRKSPCEGTSPGRDEPRHEETSCQTSRNDVKIEPSERHQGNSDDIHSINDSALGVDSQKTVEVSEKRKEDQTTESAKSDLSRKDSNSGILPKKRGRGRPRKYQAPKESVCDNSILEKDQPIIDVEQPQIDETSNISSPRELAVKRRGRPRKSHINREVKIESESPIVYGKRKRKPTRKLYEDDFIIDDEDVPEARTSISPQAKKRDAAELESSKCSEGGRVEDRGQEDREHSKHESGPDITISINEETGALLSVSVSNAETENLKSEERLAEGDDQDKSNGQTPLGNNALAKELSLARKVMISMCPACNRGFREKHRFHQHIFGSSCISKKQAREKQFKIPPDLESLIKEVHQEVKEPVCPRCDKKFSQLFHAQMHYAAGNCIITPEEKYNGLVLNEESQSYHCRHCDFASPVVHRVMLHEQRKHMEKTVPCPLCHKLYSSQALVREHIKAVHAIGSERSVCEHCGISVATKSLQQHMKAVHDPNYVRPQRKTRKIYTCTQCQNFRSTSYAKFFRHRVKAHKDADKKCHFCEEKFAMIGDLNRHVKYVHEGLQQETVQCPQCGKQVTKKNIAAHIKMVHDKIRKHFCETCGRAFLTKFTLRQHMETHKPSGMRDTKFLCAFCGKGFINKTHYTDHLNTHTGARPYVCTVCYKTFRCCPALTKHKELHSSINLHCAICNLHFPSRKALRIHNNKEHSTSMYKCVCGAEYNSDETLVAHRRRCGQYQQAHPMENHQVLQQQEQQMAMIIQPDDESEQTPPGTYIVMEAKDGEQTVMVLQSLNDLQDQDVVEAIAGSEVMTSMSFSDETQMKAEQGTDGGVNTDNVMTITDSGLVTLPTADIMAITGQTATDPIKNQTIEVTSDGTTLLEMTQDVASLSMVPDHGVVQATSNTNNSAALTIVTQQVDQDLNRYLCGYCQSLFTSLGDVQDHMLSEHMAAESGEVELALHDPTGEDDNGYDEPGQTLLT